MMHKEAVLISAYTGYLLAPSFADVHKFCEELLGRPIMTHELGFKTTQDEIQEKCKPMIIKMIDTLQND
jgi:hypothetical protein